MVEELAEALIVNPENIPPVNSEERLPDPMYVLDILGSLITVSLAGSNSMKLYSIVVSGSEISHEEISREVRFAHFSVKEFLLSRSLQESSALNFSLNHNASHLFLTESCLRYIIHCSNILTCGSQSTHDSMPLIFYACEYWHIHIKKLPLVLKSQLDALVLSLFTKSSMFSLWISALYSNRASIWSDTPHDSDARLHYASYLGLRHVVRHLLDHGAEVDARIQRRGTALCSAAKGGHVEVVKMLLKHGTDISKAVNDQQVTALHYAAAGGFDDVIKLLIGAGAVVDASDQEGWTPLQDAVRTEHLSTASLLLELGANIEEANFHKQTALHWGAYSNDLVLLGFLIRKGANVNAKNAKGETAMHFAASSGDLGVLKELLEAGAEVDIKSNIGQTPLFWAATAGQQSTATILLEYGADVNA
jgi:ankyrin repeat protein